MSFQLRRIAAFIWHWAKTLLAYVCAGIEWACLAIATGCTWAADLAEDAAVRLRR